MLVPPKALPLVTGMLRYLLTVSRLGCPKVLVYPISATAASALRALKKRRLFAVVEPWWSYSMMSTSPAICPTKVSTSGVLAVLVEPPPVRSPETRKSKLLYSTRTEIDSVLRSWLEMVTEPPLKSLPPCARMVAFMPPPKSMTVPASDPPTSSGRTRMTDGWELMALM